MLVTCKLHQLFQRVEFMPKRLSFKFFGPRIDESTYRALQLRCRTEYGLRYVPELLRFNTKEFAEKIFCAENPLEMANYHIALKKLIAVGSELVPNEVLMEADSGLAGVFAYYFYSGMYAVENNWFAEKQGLPPEPVVNNFAAITDFDEILNTHTAINVNLIESSVNVGKVVRRYG